MLWTAFNGPPQIDDVLLTAISFGVQFMLRESAPWGTQESVAAEYAVTGVSFPEEAMKAALESQMGLRLEPQKPPKKQLVIDCVERLPQN